MGKTERRLAIVSRHLSAAPVSSTNTSHGVPGKTMPKPIVFQEFTSDAAWAGKPFWMLNILKFKHGGEGEKKFLEYIHEMDRSVLPSAGARIVFNGYCRTVIGRKDYHRVAVVEYPSPAAFAQMISSDAVAQMNQILLGAVEERYLIPMSAGWYQIHQAAPAPSQALSHFTAGSAGSAGTAGSPAGAVPVWGPPNGLVGSSVEGARPGETSSTQDQAEAFVADKRIGDTSIVWHLNLLRFFPGRGKESYTKYARAMGKKGGILSQFGARSTLSSACFKSLIGEVDFDQAIFVEYPCRDSYLTMGTNETYLKTAHFRHLGLQDTYIISCLPEFVDKSP